MVELGTVIRNAFNKETFIFSGPIDDPAVAMFEVVLEEGGTGGGNAIVHIHPLADEQFTVTSGRLKVVIADREQLLGPGETAVVPRGAPHYFANATDGQTVFKVEFRPAQQHVRFFANFATATTKHPRLVLGEGRAEAALYRPGARCLSRSLLRRGIAGFHPEGFVCGTGADRAPLRLLRRGRAAPAQRRLKMGVRKGWRSRRDSNPRYAFTAYNGLANRRLQPLGHSSTGGALIEARWPDCKPREFGHTAARAGALDARRSAPHRLRSQWENRPKSGRTRRVGLHAHADCHDRGSDAALAPRRRCARILCDLQRAGRELSLRHRRRRDGDGAQLARTVPLHHRARQSRRPFELQRRARASHALPRRNTHGDVHARRSRRLAAGTADHRPVQPRRGSWRPWRRCRRLLSRLRHPRRSRQPHPSRKRSRMLWRILPTRRARPSPIPAKLWAAP